MRWLQFFVEAIGSLEPRMRLAMQADGCRENWLQTEIMMFAAARNISVWTNSAQLVRPDGALDKRGKYDLSSYEDDSEDAAVTMVAEIKIMDGYFSPKCLVGSTAQWRDFIPKGDARRYITPDEILAADHGEWGLIPDAARLLRHSCENSYLILVLLDRGTDQMTKSQLQLHAAMNGVTFVDDPAKEETRTFDGYTVKVWSL